MLAARAASQPCQPQSLRPCGLAPVPKLKLQQAHLLGWIALLPQPNNKQSKGEALQVLERKNYSIWCVTAPLADAINEISAAIILIFECSAELLQSRAPRKLTTSISIKCIYPSRPHTTLRVHRKPRPVNAASQQCMLKQLRPGGATPAPELTLQHPNLLG